MDTQPSLDALHAALAAVCPIDGVAADGTIWFTPGATDQQKAAAQAAFAAFDQMKANLIAYAYQKHTKVSQGGVTVQGIAIVTDAMGRTDLAGAVQLAALNPSQTFNWVTDSGAVALTAAQITTIGQVVGAWVQSTYTVLGQVVADINSGAITTMDQIDAAQWPANT